MTPDGVVARWFLRALERSGAEEALREGLKAGLASLDIDEVRQIIDEELEDELLYPERDPAT